MSLLIRQRLGPSLVLSTGRSSDQITVLEVIDPTIVVVRLRQHQEQSFRLRGVLLWFLGIVPPGVFACSMDRAVIVVAPTPVQPAVVHSLINRCFSLRFVEKAFVELYVQRGWILRSRKVLGKLGVLEVLYFLPLQ